MKKISKLLITLFILSLFVLPTISFAGTPTLSVSNITQTSATFTVTGLESTITPNPTRYSVVLEIANLLDHSQLDTCDQIISLESPTYIGDNSEFTITAESLCYNRTYFISVRDNTTHSNIIDNIFFRTLNYSVIPIHQENISSTNITTTSVDLNITGLELPDSIYSYTYSIEIGKYGESDNIDSKLLKNITNSTAIVHFDGLSSNTKYRVNLWKYTLIPSGASFGSPVEAPVYNFTTLTTSTNSYSWSFVGNKIYKSTVDGATGNDILVAYSGLGVDQTGAEKWAQALVNKVLKSKGVGTVYAVAGPVDEYYVNKTVIANTKLVADLLVPGNYETGNRIFIVAHSSGEYPAIEFLNQINANSSVIDKSITVFDIEGDTGTVSAGFDVKAADYSVVGHSIITPTEYSVNYSKIAGVGILKDISVDTTGCIAVLPYCIHMRLVNKESTQGFNAVNADYNSITTQNIEASYLTGITPSTSTPTPKAVTGIATDITINSATLNGTVNVNNNENLIAYFQYTSDADYKAAPNDEKYGALKASVDEVTGNKDTAVSASITDLDPSTVYHYRLKMVSIDQSDDTVILGNDKTFTTEAVDVVLSGTTCNASNCFSPKTCVNEVCTAPTTATTSSGGAGLVPCTENCGFSDVFKLINNVVHFILFNMAIPIAAIMFAYAGFLLLTSGGETSKRTKAKSIFTNVAIGLIIAVAAFLIIKTILSIAGYKSEWTTWFGF